MQLLLTLLLTLQCSAQAEILGVNRKFGTVSNYISKVYFNLKPFVVVRELDYSSLLDDNKIMLTEEGLSRDRIASLDTQTLPDGYKWSHQAGARTVNEHQALLDSSGKVYNDSAKALESFLQQLISDSPLPITYTEGVVKEKTSVTTESRKKRFVFTTTLATVMGVAKMLAPIVCKTIIKQATKAIEQNSLQNAPKHLTGKYDNYVEAVAYKHPNLDYTKTHTPLQNVLEPFNQSVGKYVYHHNMAWQAAGVVKLVQLTDKLALEVQVINNRRAIMAARNNKFREDILAVQRGKLPISFLPVEQMKQVLEDMSARVLKDGLPLQHIDEAANPHNFYQYVTPILIMDGMKMMLLLILPMAGSASQLALYKISTIPFLTKEDVALEVALPKEYYASSADASSHILMSAEDYRSCTSYNDILLCRLSRPIIKKRSSCYASLLITGSSDREIFSQCNFRKADGNVHHFLNINANRYAYFLPKKSSLHLHCPRAKTEVPFQNMTDIERSGIFAFPRGCHAIIDEFVFYDTTLETINVLNEQNDFNVSFMDIATGAWPNQFPSVESQLSLLKAAKDTNTSEPLFSLSTRAKVYQVVRNMLTMGEERSADKIAFHQFLYYLSSLAVLLTSFAISQIYVLCCRRLPAKREFHIPKHLPFRKTANGEQKEIQEEPIYQQVTYKNKQSKRPVILKKMTTNVEEEIALAPRAEAPPPADYELQQQQHSRVIDEFQHHNQYLRVQPTPYYLPQ